MDWCNINTPESSHLLGLRLAFFLGSIVDLTLTNNVGEKTNNVNLLNVIEIVFNQ